jgi:hypothetical protein
VQALLSEMVGRQAANVCIVVDDQDAGYMRLCGHAANLTTKLMHVWRGYKTVQNRWFSTNAGYMWLFKWAPCNKGTPSTDQENEYETD